MAHRFRSAGTTDPACLDTPDCHGLSPLHWAVKKQRIDAIRTLLQLKASVEVVDNKGQTPLDYALKLTEANAANQITLDALLGGPLSPNEFEFVE